jgi:hypothetical protein
LKFWSRDAPAPQKKSPRNNPVDGFARRRSAILRKKATSLGCAHRTAGNVALHVPRNVEQPVPPPRAASTRSTVLRVMKAGRLSAQRAAV